MVSIVMPTYNNADLICESIYSVLQQSYKDFELLIVDDGSDDDTEHKIRSVNDDRISYYKLPHSGFIGEVRNFGIKKSKRELIAFIDSDDLWEKDKLSKQIEALAVHHEAGFIISDVLLFEGKEIIKPHVYGKEGFAVLDIFPKIKDNRFGIYPSTLLFKKNCLEKTGLLNQNLRASDFDFIIQLTYHFKAIVIYEPLVRRRIHSFNQHSRFAIDHYKDYISTFEFLFKNQMLERKYLKKAKLNAYYKMGEIYRRQGEKGSARKNYIQALKYNLFYTACYRRILSSFIKP